MAAEARACGIVAEALNIQGAVVLSDTMATLPAWDSLAHVGVVMGTEAELGRRLTADEIASLNSVAAVARLLASSRG